MKEFLRLRLLGSVLALSLAARPTLVTAGEPDILGAATAVIPGAIALATLAAVDGGTALGQCICMESIVGNMSGCPAPPWAVCITAGLSIASMALGVAQAMSASETAAAVKGTDNEGDFEETGEDDESSTPTVSSVFADTCKGDNPPKYLCSSDGLAQATAELNKTKSLMQTGKIPTTDEALKNIELAEQRLEQLKNGDYAGILASDGGDYSDYAAALSGNATPSNPGVTNGDGDGSSGTGGSINWGGTNGRAGFAGLEGAKVGPTGAYLDKTEWNGSLDQIDPRTGKSLTMWQRATRRYMGTPDGQRGFTLARIESLRKQSALKLAEAAKPKTPKKVAKKSEETPYVPVVISPKEFRKH